MARIRTSLSGKVRVSGRSAAHSRPGRIFKKTHRQIYRSSRFRVSHSYVGSHVKGL